MPRPKDFTGVVHTWFERESMFLMDNYRDTFHDKYRVELTAEELKEEMKDYYQIFNESNNPPKVKKFVETGINNIKKLHDEVQITKVVCMGIGRFNQPWFIPRDSATSDVVTKYENTKGSHHRVVNSEFHQVIFLENVIKVLYDMGHRIEHVYFQDPDFVQAEIEFLKNLAFEVLEDPSAQLKTTRNTLLYNPGTEPFVIAECLSSHKRTYPALYIGFKIENLYINDARAPVDEPTRKVLRDFEKETEGAKMELLNGEGWEHNVVIRWLRN